MPFNAFVFQKAHNEEVNYLAEYPSVMRASVYD